MFLSTLVLNLFSRASRIPPDSEQGLQRSLEEEIHEENEDEENEDEEDEDDDGVLDDGAEDLSRPPHLTTSPTVSSSVPTRWERLKAFLDPPTPVYAGYIPQFRYTPVISGVVIPFSILLEIPGLTEQWYVRTEENKTVDRRPNPAILDVGLALSMTCALIANIALVARFLERRIKVMTIICVVFLTAHDLINIIALTVFGIEHRFDDGFTYGQAFWMTLCSTVASTFTNFTLIVDLVRTPDFSKSGSGLTRKQRSLAVIIIVLLCYLALGALINSFLLHQSFIDALYFTVCSIETIGFGDIVPISTGARFWVCLWSAFGIVNLGVTVGMTRETVLEALEAGYRNRMGTVLRIRKATRKRHRAARRWRTAVERRLHEIGAPLWVQSSDDVSEEGKGVHARRVHNMRLNIDALSQQQLEDAAKEAGAPLDELLPVVSTRPSGLHRALRALFTWRRLGKLRQEEGREEVEPHETTAAANFDALKKRVKIEERRALQARITVALTLFLLFWTIGSAIFMATENWEYGTAMYFCFIAFTTLGYGDYSPKSPAGRSVFVVWALLGVGTMTILISVVSETYSSRYKSAIHTGAFDKAIRRYRQRASEAPQLATGAAEAEAHARTPQSREDPQSTLDELPAKILEHARAFHENVQFFMGARGDAPGAREMPDGLVKLLDDIAGVARSAEGDVEKVAAVQEGPRRPGLGRRIRHEVMHDKDARHTLFTLSIETALKKIIDAAQEAATALEERNMRLHQDNSEEEAAAANDPPDSGTTFNDTK